jgi:hypothetical protein
MHNSTDLMAALNFVSQRIEAEAKLQGEPLNDEERLLLHNLPTESLIDASPTSDSPVLVPRDLGYEKLCSIAKAAYRSDLSIRQVAASRCRVARGGGRLNMWSLGGRPAKDFS